MKKFNYIETINFLLRIGATSEQVFKNRLRINTLLNIGNKLYAVQNKNAEVIANHLKMFFILLEEKEIQQELLKLNYNILTKNGSIRSFWSIIHEINKIGPHPKLINIFGPQVWDTIKYLFKYK